MKKRPKGNTMCTFQRLRMEVTTTLFVKGNAEVFVIDVVAYL